MDLPQYAELFLAESRDQLGTLNRVLLEWERQPDATEPVVVIFRAVHTLKGMAASMGFHAVADLAHKAENVFDLLRRGDRAPSDELFELLFHTADVLERAVEEAVAGREAEVDTREVSRALDEAAGNLGAAAERPATTSRAGTAAPRAEPAPPATPGDGGRQVHVTVHSESPLKGARAIMVLKRLEGLGRITSVQPAPIAFERDDFDGRFAFRFESGVDDAELEGAVREAGDIDQVEIQLEETAGPQAGATAGRTRHMRVDLRRLDALMNQIGELVTARNRLTELAARRADAELDDVALKISHLAGSLQTEIVEARMTPVWQVFDRFPRLVRDVARGLGKRVSLVVDGKEIELDRAILDEIGDPLVHLLRNAVDHGIEPPDLRRKAGKLAEGKIVLSAIRERATVAIRVGDDGRGIDRAAILARAKRQGIVDAETEHLTDDLLLRILARPGFSTAVEVSAVSGRGVGIDVVATRLRAMGGTVEIRTDVGAGTTFTLRLPTTLAIVRALVAQVGGERYALPITHVAETVELDPAAITEIDGRDALWFRSRVIPLVHLRQLVGAAGSAAPRRPVIVLEVGDRRTGLVVDAMMGQQEIVVKTFDPPGGTMPIFSGATILGDGLPALILDAGGLV
jgi:two-component system chemotaxis sensor kinase CheA